MIFGAQNLMESRSVDTRLWGEAVKTMAYLLNRTYRFNLNKTPIELFTGKKPSLAHLRVLEAPPTYISTRKFAAENSNPTANSSFSPVTPKARKDGASGIRSRVDSPPHAKLRLETQRIEKVDVEASEVVGESEGRFEEVEEEEITVGNGGSAKKQEEDVEEKEEPVAPTNQPQPTPAVHKSVGGRAGNNIPVPKPPAPSRIPRFERQDYKTLHTKGKQAVVSAYQVKAGIEIPRRQGRNGVATCRRMDEGLCKRVRVVSWKSCLGFGGLTGGKEGGEVEVGVWHKVGRERGAGEVQSAFGGKRIQSN